MHCNFDEHERQEIGVGVESFCTMKVHLTRLLHNFFEEGVGYA